jgi:hypothetical protein
MEGLQWEVALYPGSIGRAEEGGSCSDHGWLICVMYPLTAPTAPSPTLQAEAPSQWERDGLVAAPAPPLPRYQGHRLPHRIQANEVQVRNACERGGGRGDGINSAKYSATLVALRWEHRGGWGWHQSARL